MNTHQTEFFNNLVNDANFYKAFIFSYKYAKKCKQSKIAFFQQWVIDVGRADQECFPFSSDIENMPNDQLMELFYECVSKYSEEIEHFYIAGKYVKQYITQNYNENNRQFNPVCELYNQLFSKKAFKHYLDDFILDLKIKKYSLEEAKKKYYKIITYYFDNHSNSLRSQTLALQGMDKNYLFTIAISGESKETWGKHIYPNEVCAFIDRQHIDKRKADEAEARIPVTLETMQEGKYYKVFKEDGADGAKPIFSKGSIIQLTKDDGTFHPGFILIKGYTNYNTVKTIYHSIRCIEEVDYTPDTKETSQPHKDTNMTPFQEKGYTPKDIFTHITRPNRTYRLSDDDETSIPEFICIENDVIEYFDVSKIKLINSTHHKKETTMNPTTNPEAIIETQINVFGVNAAELSDDQIFDKIREVELAISNLKQTKAKSKKLAGKIEEMEAQLNALVTYVDNRD